MAKIVVVEDDQRISRAVIDALVENGHEVRAFNRGFPALDAVVADPPDVVLLDLGLPDIDGRDLLKELRAVSRVPIVVATARDDESSVISTLNDGADDYVVKPYSVTQLNARIAAVMRRTRDDAGDPTIVAGGLVIDTRRHTVELDGVSITLNRREFDLLAYLAARPEQVISKQELLAEVWRQPWGGSDNTVDVHLSWLRRKLGDSASKQRFLVSVRGVGVMFTTTDASRTT